MASTSIILDILAVDRASQVLRNIGNAGTTGGRLAALGVGAVGLAVGAFAKDAVTAGADFDATLRQMAAVAGVPAPQIKELSSLALKMGADTKFSAGEAATAMLELSKGGLTAAQIKSGALKETLTLAAAGGIELGVAATTVSNALNTFGLSAEQAGQVSAALAGAANASSASVESLTQGMAQVGPSARNAGLSVQETTAALAAFANAGIQGSDAGTSLKTFLTRLVPTTKEAFREFERLGLAQFDTAKAMAYLREMGVEPLGSSQEVLEGQLLKLVAAQRGIKPESAQAEAALRGLAEAGVTSSNAFFDAEGKTKSLAEISGILASKFRNLSEEEKTRTLATLFGSDAQRAATVLANEGAEGLAKLVKATSDSAAANKVAAANMKGTKGALEQLKGSFETLQIQAGLALGPLVEKLALLGVQVLNGVIPAFGVLATVLGPLRPVAEAVAAAFGALFGFIANNQTTFEALTAAFGVLGLAMAGPTIASAAFTAAMTAYMGVAAFAIGLTSALTTAFASLTAVILANPFVALGVLLVAVGVALVVAYKRSEEFRDKVDAAFAKVKAVGQALATFVTQTIPAAFNDVKNRVAAGVAATRDAVSTAFTAIRNVVTTVTDQIKTIFGPFFSFIAGVFTSGLQIIKALLEIWWALVKAGFITLFDGIKLIVSTAWTALSAIVTTGLTAIRTAITAGMAAIQAVFGPVFAAIRAAFTTAWAGFTSAVTTGGAAIRGAITAGLSTVVSLFSGPFNAARAAVSTALDSTVAMVSGLAGRFTSAVAGFGGLLVNAGRELMSGLARGIQDRIDAVVKKVQEAAEKIKRLLPGSPVKDGPLRAWNNGGAGVRLMNMLADGISTGTPAVTDALNTALSPFSSPTASFGGAGGGSSLNDSVSVASGLAGGASSALVDAVVAELRNIAEQGAENARREIDRRLQLTRTGAI